MIITILNTVVTSDFRIIDNRTSNNEIIIGNSVLSVILAESYQIEKQNYRLINNFIN